MKTEIYFVVPDTIGYTVIKNAFCPHSGAYYERVIQEPFNTIMEAEKAANELNQRIEG